MPNVLRQAHDEGRRIRVIACETRPVLQGARLTAWEMVQEAIPVTLITDNMAGHLMRTGRVDVVIVGADRIAGNGDVAMGVGIGVHQYACNRSMGGRYFYDADGELIPSQDLYLVTLANGYSFAARGSGTEPKIKFYFSVNAPLDSAAARKGIARRRATSS